MKFYNLENYLNETTVTIIKAILSSHPVSEEEAFKKSL